MKDGIGQIVGRRISGVLVKDSQKEPRQQIFLLFEDGTLYELYGHIHGTGGVIQGCSVQSRADPLVGHEHCARPPSRSEGDVLAHSVVGRL